MAYNNNIYGNTAFAAFFSGMLAGRAIRSANAPDYVALRTAALAQAVAVDALIAFDALVTTEASNTLLDPSKAMTAAIAATVIVPGDGGQALKTAIGLVTTGNVIDSNQTFRIQLLYGICYAAAAGRATQSVVAQSVQAAAIVAAWTTAIAGLVSP